MVESGGLLVTGVFARYVARVHPRNSSKHIILGTQQFKPREFATQINLDIGNSWGILRVVVDLLMKMNPGKYLILKDPNKVGCFSIISSLFV